MDEKSPKNHAAPNRRHFLKALSGVAALSASGLITPHLLASPNKSFKGSDIVTLGDTGLQVSRLAQGTGTSGGGQSSAFTRMGKASFDRLLQHSLDRGITLIDMADLYGTHPFVKTNIKQLPREKFALLTKIWPRKEDWNQPSGGAKEEIDRFRQELGVDMIDICLIHCMTNAQWPDEHKRILDELSELKAKNIVRAVGVSCHNYGALEVASEHAWVDVLLARVNHKCGREFKCDESLDKVTSVLRKARENGKGLIGMKIFADGSLVQPEQRDASLKYVLTENLVDAMTIGMQSPEQVDDVLTRMSKIG